MTKFKVGIIGYGIVGKRRRKYIDEHPNLVTIAVCDVRFIDESFRENGGKIYNNYNEIEKLSEKNRVKGKQKDGVYYYSDYEYLLKDQKLDIIFVCLPNYLSPVVTIAGLNSGCHVFCEKPPGRTVEDILKVREAEKNHAHLKLKYGFNHRYHHSVKRAKEIIDNKDFGEIINFRGVYGKSSVVPVENEWRALKKYSGGGILLDQGIHMLDLFRFFCGDFEEVKSFVSNKFWGHNVEDNAYALLRDSQGRVAMIHSSATQWQHRFRLEITFEKGYLELSGILSGTKSYGQEKLAIINRQTNSTVGSLEKQEINYLEDNSWNEEIIEFADLIINDKPVVTGNSFEALMIMKLVHSIYSADKS